MTTESAEATALFRYRVIADAIGPRLSPAERGWIRPYWLPKNMSAAAAWCSSSTRPISWHLTNSRSCGC